MEYTYTVLQLQQLESCRYLTDRERAVFDLYYRRGWAIEDVAAELYLSRTTVKQALHSMRQKAAEIGIVSARLPPS
jgi:DNA-directed RNA polymerase specialized sigma24 family protein